jgi:predicted ATPase
MDFAGNAAVQLEEARLLTQEALMQTGLDLGRHRELLPRLEQLVAQHPTREGLWRLLVLALYRDDRQADALSAFRRVREALAEELGIDPGPGLRELELAILRQDPGLDPPETAQGAEVVVLPPRVLHSRVPHPAHPLLGREDVVADVLARLGNPEVRLVSLTGPGGVGKTRTAVEIARALPQDDVVFVDLVDAASGRDVWTGIGAALGLAPDDISAESVLAVLSGRSCVLVLDNLEQVREAPNVCAELVSGAPETRFLVTSRIPLRLVAEHVVPVTTLGEGPGVELFAARARTTRPDFEVGDHNRADVLRLCERLDGLPLALEIAAAGVRMLSVQDMLERLDRGLDRLGPGLAFLPERQRTLAATASWSLDLLPGSARTLGARLSVFEGGFNVAAATEVCADPDVDADSAVDDIARLIDANLIVPLDEPGGARFRLYRIVRDVVRREVLYEEWSRLADAHAAWYCGQAERLVSELDGPGHEKAIQVFVQDEANFDRALRHAADKPDPGLVLRLVRTLAPFWIASGRSQHGSQLLGEVAPSAEGAPGGEVLTVLEGILAYHLTDWDRAINLLTESLPRVTDQPVLAVRARCHLAAALTVTGRADEGQELARQAADEAERLGVYDVLVLSLSAQAIAAAMAGDFDGELSLYANRLALAREHQDRARTVDTLTILSEIAMDNDNWPAAERHATEALSLAARWMPAEHRDTLIVLARIALAQSDLEAARSRLAQALELTLGLGETFGLAQVLRSTAGLAAADGDLQRAARLVGASERLRETTLVAVGAELDLAGFADSIRASMAQEWYDEEVAVGKSLARPDVVDLAQGVLASGSSSAS